MCFVDDAAFCRAEGTSILLAASAHNAPDGESHAPAPFYISIAADGTAHGFLLNTNRYSAWDVGNSSKDEIRISTGDSDLEYFLLAGPTPAAVLKQLASLCGLPPLPPMWSLGFKYHTLNTQPQAYVEAIVKNFSAHKIPLSHVVIENYYNSGHQLPADQFPDPKAMVAKAENEGTKVVLWLDPHVHRNGTTLGQELQAVGCVSDGWADTAGCGCNTKAGCGYADIIPEECQRIWSTHVGTELLDVGIAGFKLDQDDGGVVLFKDNTTFSKSGYSGGQMHNIYGFAFQKMFHSFYAARGQRTWMQSRGNYLGGQAWGTSSYSDGYNYDVYVRGLVNAGFTGLVWAPKGWYATCDPDYARLMMLGPQSQFNAWQHGDVPWHCNGTY